MQHAAPARRRRHLGDKIAGIITTTALIAGVVVGAVFAPAQKADAADGDEVAGAVTLPINSIAGRMGTATTNNYSSYTGAGGTGDYDAIRYGTIYGKTAFDDGVNEYSSRDTPI